MAEAEPFQPSEELSPLLPFLDDDKLQPERKEYTEIAKRYVHNGKTATRDEERCFKICEALCMGYSHRSIAKRFHTSRHTIAAIVTVLEKAGKLAPLKKRLAHKAGLVIEAGLDAIHEKIHDGTLPAQSLPIVVGVISDKKGDWDATTDQPTEQNGNLVTAEQLAQDYANLKRLKGTTLPPADSQSGETPPKPA